MIVRMPIDQWYRFINYLRNHPGVRDLNFGDFEDDDTVDESDRNPDMESFPN